MPSYLLNTYPPWDINAFHIHWFVWLLPKPLTSPSTTPNTHKPPHRWEKPNASQNAGQSILGLWLWLTLTLGLGLWLGLWLSLVPAGNHMAYGHGMGLHGAHHMHVVLIDDTLSNPMGHQYRKCLLECKESFSSDSHGQQNSSETTEGFHTIWCSSSQHQTFQWFFPWWPPNHPIVMQHFPAFWYQSWFNPDLILFINVNW